MGSEPCKSTPRADHTARTCNKMMEFSKLLVLGGTVNP